jgi:biopolymer transport protein ExbB
MFNIQETFKAFTMLGATWVMWLLLALSVVAVAVVLERFYYVLTTRDDVARLKAEVLKLLGAGDVRGAKKRLSESKSFEARIVGAGLDAIEDGPEAAQDRMEGEASLSKIFMERNLAFLGTVGNNAPFVGLLGTVIGIIRSFVALQRAGGQPSEELFYEVGEALVATAIGILVAIPAVAFFNLFQRLIRARLARADDFGKSVLARMRAGVPEAAEAAE